MSSQDIKQIFDSNPTTTLLDTDLVYLGKFPYGIADDSACESKIISPFIKGKLLAKDGVLLAATENIDGTYDNGALGVGATITDNDVADFLEIDGVEAPVGARVILAGQASQAHNGIYVVTANTGSSYILTRATDFDSASKISVGAYTAVAQGLQNEGKVFVESTIGPFVIGTSAITFIDNESGGDVVGPASASDNAMAVYDGTTGKLLKNSKVYATSAGVVISHAETTEYTTTATMTAAAIVGGIIKLTPVDGSQFFSFDTAANLYAAMGSPVLNSTVKCKIINYSTLHSTLIDITDIAMSGFGMPNFLMAPGDSFDLEGVVTDLTPLHIDWSGGQLQGTLAAQDANDVDISGGEIDGTEIGTNNPSTAQFTNVGGISPGIGNFTTLTRKQTAATHNTTATLTASEIVTGLIISTPSSPDQVLTLPSAAALYSQAGSPVQGQSFSCRFVNNSSINFITIISADGNLQTTYSPALWIPPKGVMDLDFIVTNSVTPVITISGGAGAEKTIITKTTSVTLSGTEMLGGLVMLNPADNSQTFTFPTAATLYAAMGNPVAGCYMLCQVNNISSYQATLATNTNLDITRLASLILPPKQSYDLVLIVTATGTPAISICGGIKCNTSVPEIITVSGTSKTFGVTDSNTIQECTNGSAVTLTYPLDSTADIPVGSSIEVVWSGVGQPSVVGEGGVTVESAVGTTPKIAERYAGFVITKMASNRVNVQGRLSA